MAVPDYPSGATEHWGLITYRESRLLYNENEAGASDKQATAQIVAHELAHNVRKRLQTCCTHLLCVHFNTYAQQPCVRVTIG